MRLASWWSDDAGNLLKRLPDEPTKDRIHIVMFVEGI